MTIFLNHWVILYYLKSVYCNELDMSTFSEKLFTKQFSKNKGGSYLKNRSVYRTL